MWHLWCTQTLLKPTDNRVNMPVCLPHSQHGAETSQRSCDVTLTSNMYAKSIIAPVAQSTKQHAATFSIEMIFLPPCPSLNDICLPIPLRQRTGLKYPRACGLSFWNSTLLGVDLNADEYMKSLTTVSYVCHQHVGGKILSLMGLVV